MPSFHKRLATKADTPRYFEKIEAMLIYLTLFTSNSGKNRQGKFGHFQSAL